MVGNVANVRRRLTENVKKVRERIAAACDRVGRDPQHVRLVAVAKYVDIEVVRQAMELGLIDIGESRAQQLNQRAGMIHEYLERKQVLAGRGGKIVRPHWHMVGHLQRNKVKLVLPWTDLIHSVDSLRLAEDIHEQAQQVGRVADILLQVNTSGEKTKFGIAVGAVPHLLEHLAEWPNVRLCGLMTMAPLECTHQELRLCFDRLRDVLTDLQGNSFLTPDFKELSMGMSHDFETAVESGATIVRVGRAIFEGLIDETTPDDNPHETD